MNNNEQGNQSWFSCDSSGLSATTFVVNGTRENEIGWGRNNQFPTTTTSSLFISRSIANSLSLQENDSVFLEVVMEYYLIILFLLVHRFFIHPIVLLIGMISISFLSSTNEQIKEWHSLYDEMRINN